MGKVIDSSSPPAHDSKANARRAISSVVLLVMSDAYGNPITLGSGFFVGPNAIATNFHVIQGSSSGYAKLVGSADKLVILGTQGLDQRHDLAILATNGKSVSPLSLSAAEQNEAGDEVLVTGNPEGLEGSLSTGIVSGVRTFENDSWLQITAPISPGSSGGPVLNSSGEVIGVAVATFREGQNLNFAVPTRYLKALMRSTEDIMPLSAGTRKAVGSFPESYYGRPSRQGVVGENFIWSDDPYSNAYSFSLRNLLRTQVDDVRCAVVFYDRSGRPIDYIDLHICMSMTPPSLATRVSYPEYEAGEGVRRLAGRVEIRVLDFTIGKK